MTEAVLYVSGPVEAQFDEQTHTWSVGDRTAQVVIATDGALPASAPPSARVLRPYLGLAVHGVPNYFLLSGPDTAAQKSYIARCLRHLDRCEGSRIEVRPETQRIYSDRHRDRGHRGGRYWRAVGAKIPSAFDVQSLADHGDGGGDDDVYDGPATVTVAGTSVPARVRLAGQMDPIDGRYHWRGTVVADLGDITLPVEIDVTVGAQAVPARLTERTPQAGYTVTGTGLPPFTLADIEIDAPVR